MKRRPWNIYNVGSEKKPWLYVHSLKYLRTAPINFYPKYSQIFPTYSHIFPNIPLKPSQHQGNSPTFEPTQLTQAHLPPLRTPVQVHGIWPKVKVPRGTGAMLTIAWQLGQCCLGDKLSLPVNYQFVLSWKSLPCRALTPQFEQFRHYHFLCLLWL